MSNNISQKDRNNGNALQSYITFNVNKKDNFLV